MKKVVEKNAELTRWKDEERNMGENKVRLGMTPRGMASKVALEVAVNVTIKQVNGHFRTMDESRQHSGGQWWGK